MNIKKLINITDLRELIEQEIDKLNYHSRRSPTLRLEFDTRKKKK